MITLDFITALFYEIDEQMGAIPKHPEAHLWPSEVVTLGLLHALKGIGNRPFYRWLTRDYRPLFPRLPERTRLFRLLTTHQDWARAFLVLSQGTFSEMKACMPLDLQDIRLALFSEKQLDHALGTTSVTPLSNNSSLASRSPGHVSVA